jgi:RimJ/RimL family protein N-acetyltransferase
VAAPLYGVPSPYDPTMGHPLWPMFDLRLTTTDLELRHLTEEDLPRLADMLPTDVELDPTATVYDGLGSSHQRGVIVAQEYWKGRGAWRPESWALSFGVFHDGLLIGSQGLEGEDFPTLRTVDSSSFLAVDARGRGWGKQMRRAVLALAFGRLEAEFAVTSAWHDNVESLGVSRSLGYEDNGVVQHRRDKGSDAMVHLRLTRNTWESRGSADDVTIEGFEPCRPFFAI